MTPPKLTSGSWLVIALVAAGLILALIALKVRRFPHQWQQPPAQTQPATQGNRM
jgi:hypothetical protein